MCRVMAELRAGKTRSNVQLDLCLTKKRAEFAVAYLMEFFEGKERMARLEDLRNVVAAVADMSKEMLLEPGQKAVRATNAEIIADGNKPDFLALAPGPEEEKKNEGKEEERREKGQRGSRQDRDEG